MSEWYLVANHGLVLSCIARQPEITARQIANLIGVTERTAHKIITDLNDAAYLKKERVGRRNTYEVDLSRPLRHPALQGPKTDGTAPSVGDFLAALGAIPNAQNGGTQPPSSASRGGLRKIFRRDSKPQDERGPKSPGLQDSVPLPPSDPPRA